MEFIYFLEREGGKLSRQGQSPLPISLKWNANSLKNMRFRLTMRLVRNLKPPFERE